VLPKRPNWAGIEVLVGTHYQKVRGVLRLVIYSDNNRPLRSATFNLEQVGDNSWASFRFSPIVNAEQKRFILEFRVITDNSKISISLYESHPLESKFLRIPERLGMSKVRKTLYCRMVYSGAFNEFQP